MADFGAKKLRSVVNTLLQFRSVGAQDEDVVEEEDTIDFSGPESARVRRGGVRGVAASIDTFCRTETRLLGDAGDKG